MLITSCHLLEHALLLHRQGFIPLPLRKGGKHLDLAAMDYAPLHFQTRRKRLKELAFTSLCYQLSQKPPVRSDITDWFAEFDGNIGILGGYQGLIILDFDDRGRFERWEKDNSAIVSRTPVARSPNGYHVYLRTSQPMVTSSMYSGLRRIGHLKSLGGYIVACPSVTNDGGAYEWMKDRSPLDVAPCVIDSLEALRLRPVSPLKYVYDRLLNRGYFELQ